MAEQGCGPVQAVMSDNAKCYATSLDFRDTLAELDARHILIPPYTPRWNGKIERFFRTLDTEWARSRVVAQLPPTRPRPVIVPALLRMKVKLAGRWCSSVRDSVLGAGD